MKKYLKPFLAYFLFGQLGLAIWALIRKLTKEDAKNFIVLMGDTGAGKTEICHCLKHFDNLEHAGPSHSYETPPGKLVPQGIVFEDKEGDPHGFCLLDYSGKEDAFELYKKHMQALLKKECENDCNQAIGVAVYYVVNLTRCITKEATIEELRRLATDLEIFSASLDEIEATSEADFKFKRILQPIFSHWDIIKPEAREDIAEMVNHRLGDKRIISRTEKWNVRPSICADLKSTQGRMNFRTYLLDQIDMVNFEKITI